MRTDAFRAAALPVVGGVALAAVIGVAGPAGAQADPPGNNGTVKIDGVEFDDVPDNQPHVGCVFQVDFYGYDEGDLFADVTFEAIEPTGQVEPLLEDTDIDIGEDDNSGGGSEAGLDASRTYELTDALADITPHPQQGWHVKLTVHADGSIGADTKFKVFWVSGCETPPTSSSSTSSTTSTTDHDGSSTTSTTDHDGSTTTTMNSDGTTTVPSGGGQPPSQQTDAAATSSSGGLPITGSNTLGLVALALGLVCIGAGGLIATRRLRATGEG